MMHLAAIVGGIAKRYTLTDVNSSLYNGVERFVYVSSSMIFENASVFPTPESYIADGIVTAMAAPEGLREGFNISASRELTVAQIAEIIWAACGRDPEKFTLETGPSFDVDVVCRWPDVSKAADVLSWEAQTGVEDGVADTVAWLVDVTEGQASETKSIRRN